VSISGSAAGEETGKEQRRVTLSLAALTTAVFLTFMTIGLPLPVIPLYVGHDLAFGDVLVGLSVGIQFLATICTRGLAGREAGPGGKPTSAVPGRSCCAAWCSAPLPAWP
jgi:hypothetical protein